MEINFLNNFDRVLPKDHSKMHNINLFGILQKDIFDYEQLGRLFWLAILMLE